MKELNDKGMIYFTEKEHQGRHSFEGGGDCNTPVSPNF
jgi:hypothetical protein